MYCSDSEAFRSGVCPKNVALPLRPNRVQTGSCLPPAAFGQLSPKHLALLVGWVGDNGGQLIGALGQNMVGRVCGRSFTPNTFCLFVNHSVELETLDDKSESQSSDI